MNKKIILLVLSTGLLNACSESMSEVDAPVVTAKAVETETIVKTDTPTFTLNTDTQKISYSYGYNSGKRFQSQIKELDLVAYAEGMKDAFEKNETKIPEQEIAQTLRDYHAKLKLEMEKERLVQGKINQTAGEKFLAENATKEDVVVLDSGLQYKVMQAGNGVKPTKEDIVSVHYRGTLIDGTEFDSSHNRGKPVSFPVQAVIPGWIEAIQLMQTGAKWMLYVPSQLAYGPGGPGGKIGPNSTLIFEVELLEIIANADEPKNKEVSAQG